MIKNKFLKIIFIYMFIMIGIVTTFGLNTMKVNAESSGWINVSNSWRYYSGPDISTGWTYYKGYWYYLDENGMMKTGWIKDAGKWYYLDANSGKMITGWIEENGKWYYLNSSGEMIIGWLKYNGSLYYLNNEGVMVKNIYIGSYYLGPDGAWIEGTDYESETGENKNN